MQRLASSVALGLVALGGLVERAGRRRGGVAAIEGPAGIGKTSLGREAATLARAHGMAVLSACGSELERGFGFGAVRQLFEPVLADADHDRRRNLLDSSARLAAPPSGSSRPSHSQTRTTPASP